MNSLKTIKQRFENSKLEPVQHCAGSVFKFAPNPDGNCAESILQQFAGQAVFRMLCSFSDFRLQAQPGFPSEFAVHRYFQYF